MAPNAHRSLKYEYELYVESEIEDYKDSIPRNALLKIGDEAVAILQSGDQFTLDELLLWQEVDRIIIKRLRLPTYRTWRARKLRDMEAMRRPERWGLSADAPLVRAIRPADPGRALVAGPHESGQPLYLAANGHRVTTLEAEPASLARVRAEAEAAGIGERVDAHLGGLREWKPDARYSLVVWTTTALAGLSSAECARVIQTLQSATVDGGVHLVQTIIAGRAASERDEILRRYEGWDVSLEQTGERTLSLVARKSAA